jgi:hypothetical protein
LERKLSSSRPACLPYIKRHMNVFPLHFM